MATSLGSAGAVTHPAAAASIASVSSVPPGTYEVDVTTYQTGTVDTATPTNMKLQVGSTDVQLLLSTAIATRTIVRVTLDAAATIKVIAVAQPAAGAVCNAQITITRCQSQLR